MISDEMPPSSRDLYRQCTMRNGARTLVSWIPNKYARVGLVLRLSGEDGWQVINAHQRLEERFIPDAHAGARGHRRRTGDSLPR